MPLFRSCPFEELVVQATDEKNVSDNWELILDICDKAVNYEEGPKLILQAIARRLYSNVPRVVIQALLLLDSCVKNCGKRFHLEVSSRNFVLELRKLLQKMHPCTVDKLKSLIKKWAETEFRDDPELGLIPSLYYQLKSEGVQFPEEISEKEKVKTMCTNPDAVSSQEEEEDIVKALALSLKETHRSNTITDETLDGGKTTQPVRTELCKVRALYDFEAAEDNELTIKAGEIIVVIDKSNDSWWKGTNQRGEGYFPVSFITEDLSAEIELEKVEDKQSEDIKEKEEEVIEEPVVIDEAKIHLCLELLTEAGPTDKYPDDDDVLALEQECYAMSSLVENKLQEIDKKFTILDSLNDEIMKAIQTYNRLTRDSMGAGQHVYYYTVAADGTAESQQPQEVVSNQSSSQHYGTIPRVITKHSAGPLPDNIVHMSSGLHSHPTNLSSAQIRANLMNATFPPQSNVSHYVTPYKSSPDHPTIQPGLSLQNIPNASMSYQVPVKMNVVPLDESAKSRTIVSTGLPASHENLAVLTSGVPYNPQRVPVFFHYPNVTPGVMRNVIFSGNVPAAHIRPAMTDVSQVSPLSQPVGSAITQPTTTVHEAAAVEISRHDLSNELSNTSAVVTNTFSENATLPTSAATPVERYPGNVTN